MITITANPEEVEMYFLTKWIYILFLWGGIGLIVSFLLHIKPDKNQIATLNLKKFRTAMFYLLLFVMLSTIGHLELYIRAFGDAALKIQFVNNLLVGIIFLIFLTTLRRSMHFITSSDSPK